MLWGTISLNLIRSDDVVVLQTVVEVSDGHERWFVAPGVKRRVVRCRLALSCGRIASAKSTALLECWLVFVYFLYIYVFTFFVFTLTYICFCFFYYLFIQYLFSAPTSIALNFIALCATIIKRFTHNITNSQATKRFTDSITNCYKLNRLPSK